MDILLSDKKKTLVPNIPEGTKGTINFEFQKYGSSYNNCFIIIAVPTVYLLQNKSY